jgi:hypothetical protein
MAFILVFPLLWSQWECVVRRVVMLSDNSSAFAFT